LDPAVDGGVVGLNPTLGEQLLDVAIRQREAQIPGTASPITSGGKQKPTKADRTIGAGRGRRVLMATVCLLWLAHSRCNSAGAYHIRTRAVHRSASFHKR
jgi:hypothetical protein